MIREYDSDSEKEYTAPKAQLIVEPEPMISKWIKRPIPYLVGLYLLVNLSGFLVTENYRSKEVSKSEIEERIDEDYSDRGLVKFIDDLSKPGRELAYLICGDGEQ